MKHGFFLLFGLMIALYIYGQQPQQVPARMGVIERIQPNGDTLHICLRGDERRHWIATTDGWQIEENKEGELCYAIHKGGGVRAGRHIAHDEGQRSRKEKRYMKRRGIKVF